MRKKDCQKPAPSRRARLEQAFRDVVDAGQKEDDAGAKVGPDDDDRDRPECLLRAGQEGLFGQADAAQKRVKRAAGGPVEPAPEVDRHDQGRDHRQVVEREVDVLPLAEDLAQSEREQQRECQPEG